MIDNYKTRRQNSGPKCLSIGSHPFLPSPCHFFTLSPNREPVHRLLLCWHPTPVLWRLNCFFPSRHFLLLQYICMAAVAAGHLSTCALYINLWIFAICTSPLIHFVRQPPHLPPPPPHHHHPNFFIADGFNFLWVSQSSQEKLKTILMQNFGG